MSPSRGNAPVLAGNAVADLEFVVESLSDIYPSRGTQIRQLAHLLAPHAPPIPSLVIYGLTATGKTSIIKDILQNLKTRHIVIQCKECITGRHLLEKTLAACCTYVETLPGHDVDRSRYSRCENLGALLAHLQRLLSGMEDRFVLVFDGIDQQREAPSTLEAGLARFSEHSPNLTVVFIATIPRSLAFHGTPPPHVHFSAYTRKEAIEILLRDPSPILVEEQGVSLEDNAELWANFCATVWDTQAKFVSRDIVSFRAVAEKLWPSFIQQIQEGKLGVRAFSKLIVANRSLFQSGDLMLNKLVSQKENEKHQQQYLENLSYYTKFLLCAAYLASYNPARTDSIYFMKSTEKKKRRKGGGGKVSGRAAKHRKVPRRLLAPSPFPLERLLAIFHAILPHDVKPSIDIYTQLATLTSLRLLNRAGLGSDTLDPTAKWKVNASWEYVLRLGRGVGLELSEYAFEG